MHGRALVRGDPLHDRVASVHKRVVLHASGQARGRPRNVRQLRSFLSITTRLVIVGLHCTWDALPHLLLP